jgi:hypothetical protein
MEFEEITVTAHLDQIDQSVSAQVPILLGYFKIHFLPPDSAPELDVERWLRSARARRDSEHLRTREGLQRSIFGFAQDPDGAKLREAARIQLAAGFQ